jgi:hypothetical protein
MVITSRNAIIVKLNQFSTCYYLLQTSFTNIVFLDNIYNKNMNYICINFFIFDYLDYIFLNILKMHCSKDLFEFVTNFKLLILFPSCSLKTIVISLIQNYILFFRLFLLITLLKKNQCKKVVLSLHWKIIWVFLSKLIVYFQ